MLHSAFAAVGLKAATRPSAVHSSWRAQSCTAADHCGASLAHVSTCPHSTCPHGLRDTHAPAARVPRILALTHPPLRAHRRAPTAARPPPRAHRRAPTAMRPPPCAHRRVAPLMGSWLVVCRWPMRTHHVCPQLASAVCRRQRSADSPCQSSSSELS